MTKSRAQQPARGADKSHENQGIDTEYDPGDPCPDPGVIVGYVLNEPTLRNDKRLYTHFKNCPDCRMELDALRRAIDKLPD
jgi:hypothetical protein